MGSPDVAVIHQGVADKYRKVAESPEGLFKYPTGESSALGLGYPAQIVGAVPADIGSSSRCSKRPVS